MNLTDYILVSRNNILYKAKITALSGLYCFKFARDQLSTYLTNISASVDDSAEVYSDSHYTKTEIKEDFCTISSVNNLTANAKYVPIETAENATSSLLTRENIDSWEATQTEYCATLLETEFTRIKDIIKQKGYKLLMAGKAIEGGNEAGKGG